MRVLVCGGRDFEDEAAVFAALEHLHAESPIAAIIHGGARGADKLADAWAESRAIAREKYQAQWDRWGRSAGPLRNQLMLKEGKPDLVVAFPGGRGTADMVRRAKQSGIAVREISDATQALVSSPKNQ